MKKNLFTRMVAVALTTVASATPLTTAKAIHTNYYSDRYMRVVGDVDENGIIDASDATMVLGEYAALSVGKSDFDNDMNKFVLADFNIDNKIDASDATNILETYVYNSTHTDPQLPIYGFFLSRCVIDGVEDWHECKTYEEAQADFSKCTEGMHPALRRNYLYQIYMVRFTPNDLNSWNDWRTLIADERLG